MNCHLIAVEVGVIGLAYQRMQLNRFTLYEKGLKGLYTKPMQSWSTIEEHWMLLYNLVQYRKYLWCFRFDQHLGFLYVVYDIFLNEFFHDKRLEELEGHLSRKTALPHLKLWPNNYYRSARVVDSLTQ